ncbi:MAG: TldD/PmbA family protein [Gammaproteobacteria bacterium]
MLDLIASRFKKIAPAVDFWSLRIVNDQRQQIAVRQDILQPVQNSSSAGIMLTVIIGDGIGYAATSDVTESGLRTAITHASQIANYTKGKLVFNVSDLTRPSTSGQYATPIELPWDSMSLKDKITMLHDNCAALKVDDKIVDWHSSISYSKSETVLLTSDDVSIEQTFHYIQPELAAVANEGAKTQIRTGGGSGTARQGGLEQLALLKFQNKDEAVNIANEALALLQAPECPSDTLDILLMPGQMMLQIHESIGHPLELDRILGDERNYAGTSFVTQDMFGHYQYGSELLNISFDPTLSSELASYGFDDDGTSATKEFIIKDGVLKRPLGGATSQSRAGIEGVANSRASSWNRPTIDRMANLNLEPGDSSLETLIASIENGVLMDSNCSWSIDDSRNKFQFGCEFGQLIKDGKRQGLVRNPNYRGISATFWRNLAMVGDESTFDILGTPFCGKGEPNQLIQVGHASPACVFHNVEVFGGEV